MGFRKRLADETWERFSNVMGLKPRNPELAPINKRKGRPSYGIDAPVFIIVQVCIFSLLLF